MTAVLILALIVLLWFLLFGGGIGCATIRPPVPAPVPTPSPSPVPPPDPPPPPTPEPTPASCHVQRDPQHFVDLRIGHIGTNPQLYSATALYCGLPLLLDVFPVHGTKCSTLGVDGKSEQAVACEKEWSGPPSWQATDLSIVTPLNSNPYNCKIAEVLPPATSGKLKACGLSGCSNEITYP